MRLILLTRAMESSAEVLPSLGLLGHHVRVLSAEPTALLSAPDADALLIDGRRDLPAVRGLTRLLRQTGVEIPIVLVTTEGGLPAIQWDWGMDEVLVDTTSPAEVEARLRLAVSRIAPHRRGQLRGEVARAHPGPDVQGIRALEISRPTSRTRLHASCSPARGLGVRLLRWHPDS